MCTETNGVGDIVEIARAIFLSGFIPEDCSYGMAENGGVVDFSVQFGFLNGAVAAVADVVLAPDNGEPAERTVANVVKFVFVEGGADADADEEAGIPAFEKWIAVVGVPASFEAGAIAVGGGNFEDRSGFIKGVKSGAIIGGFNVSGEAESGAERRFDEFVGTEFECAPDDVEVGPPVGGKAFPGKVSAGNERPFEARKFGGDARADADTGFVCAEGASAIFEVGAVVTSDRDDAKAIIKREIGIEIVAGSE